MPLNKSVENLTGRSYLLISSQAGSGKEIVKIAKKFGVPFPKTSPDILEVKPEKLHITIDQVRSLRASVNQRPVEGQFKLIIIHSAHLLTTEAQNALLKVLEEPPAHAVIILRAKNKESLLPTILSRTEIIIVAEEVEATETNIFSDTKDLLREISEVKNSHVFLDGLIIRLFSQLLEKGNFGQKNRILRALESAKEAKKMIEANVDPRFVLTSLVFSVN